MGLYDTARNWWEGQGIHTGSWGLPEFGMTEAVAQGTGLPQTAQGGSNIFSGAETARAASNPPGSTSAVSTRAPSGQVQGVSTYNPPSGVVSGGTSGGGGGSAAADWARYHPNEGAMPTGYGGEGGGEGGGGQDALLAEAERAYAPVLSAYDALTAYLQGGLPGTQAMIGAEGEQQVAGLRGEEAGRLAQYGTQRGTAEAETGGAISTAEGETKSAVGEARRQVAELQQGIQAKYGGTTGTGRFVSEIMGAQGTRNIAGYRQALTTYIGGAKTALNKTLDEIRNAEDRLKTDVMNKVAEVDMSVTKLKKEAKDAVDYQLHQINVQRGQAEQAKAQARMEIVQNFQNQQNQIRQWGEQQKATYQTQSTDMLNQLRMLQARSMEQFSVAFDQFGLPYAEPIRGAITGSGRGLPTQGTTTGTYLAPKATEEEDWQTNPWGTGA